MTLDWTAPISLSCLVLAGLVTAAEAADWYTGAAQDTPSADWLVAVDASTTLTTTGSAFASTSGTFAAGGTLAESGPRVRVEGLAGRYEYTSTSRGSVTGEQFEGSLLAGYEWIETNRAVSTYLGVTARDNRISVPDPTNPVVGTALGVKAAVSAYAEPTRDTMMFGYGSYSSAYNAYYARAKFGYDIGGRVFVGPEAAALGDDFYRQWRVGLHVTGLRVGLFQLSAAAGFLSDRRQGAGAYTTIDARAQF